MKGADGCNVHVVGGAATGCMPARVVNATLIRCGRSASVCLLHHMTVRGRGTDNY